MANHRPKSLSELNNVYDKAMRAERAIKESSNLLSVSEDAETPRTENIFDQLENKAIQAEKNKVFDPDITNIANDFLKRYAQPEKPKATPKEIKRPAPTIQSIYHTAAKPRQDIALGSDNVSSLGDIKAPSVPLHKPSPTMPAVQPAPVAAEPEKETEAPLPPQEAPVPAKSETDVITAPATVVTDRHIADASLADTAIAKPETPVAQSKPKYAPPRNVSPRVRITSTERNELMEEYLRVMSDDDEEDTYKKPLFSFFKKKKKYEEEFDEESAPEFFEKSDSDEDSAEEITPVPFDNSDVKYTDEYSDAPEEESESQPAQDNMGIYDYIEADFDYDEEDSSDSEDDGILDMSFSDEIKPAEEELPAEEEITEDTEEASQEAVEEIAELTEEVVETDASAEESETIDSTETEAEEESTTEDAEAVVYPQEETTEEVEESPTEGMVFEDIFSVSDEAKRSHTGGNWEEVFGESFNEDAEESQQQDSEELPAVYPEFNEDSSEEYAEPTEEAGTAPDEIIEDDEDNTQEEEDEPVLKEKKGSLLLRILTVVISVLCITSAAATLIISSILDVNSGNLISDRYRVYSVSEDLTALELSKDTLVITENTYAHADDLYVYRNLDDTSYNFGKVISSATSLSGDYLYVTESNSGTELINRDNSMGVVIATYEDVGGILAAICQYYILIAGALILLAVAMIVCFILLSRKKTYEEDITDDYDRDEDSTTDDADNSDTDEDEEESDYYSDYDTDGIEQGLFSNI